jgi:hypothetical protein
MEGRKSAVEKCKLGHFGALIENFFSPAFTCDGAGSTSGAEKLLFWHVFV